MRSIAGLRWLQQQPDGHGEVGSIPRFAPMSSPRSDVARIVAQLKSRPWVQLFGPVRLHNAAGDEPINAATGRANQATIDRAIELVALLVARPGASAVEVHDALWPGRPAKGPSASSTRNTLTSRARRWLGHAPDGAPYFPHGTAAAYRLHEAVTSDWEVLLQLVGDDVQQAPTVRLQAAFDLVLGKPFADVPDRRYGWAEALRMEMLATVDELCHVLFQRYVNAGDVARARAVAARARSMGSLNELVWRDALMAEQLAGDRVGFERIAEQLQRALRALGDGYELEPETRELVARGREQL